MRMRDLRTAAVLAALAACAGVDARPDFDEARARIRADTGVESVFDPSAPDFWTMTIESVDVPTFQPIAVDTDAAVRTALERRTDLLRSTKSLEVNDVQIRYLRNQTMPELSAQCDNAAERVAKLAAAHARS